MVDIFVTAVIGVIALAAVAERIKVTADMVFSIVFLVAVTGSVQVIVAFDESIETYRDIILLLVVTLSVTITYIFVQHGNNQPSRNRRR